MCAARVCLEHSYKQCSGTSQVSYSSAPSDTVGPDKAQTHVYGLNPTRQLCPQLTLVLSPDCPPVLLTRVMEQRLPRPQENSLLHPWLIKKKDIIQDKPEGSWGEL